MYVCNMYTYIYITYTYIFNMFKSKKVDERKWGVLASGIEAEKRGSTIGEA